MEKSIAGLSRVVGGIHRKLGGTKITSSGSDSRDPPQPPRPGPPRIHSAIFASVRKLREQLADEIHKVTYLAQPSSVKLLQPITESLNEEG